MSDVHLHILVEGQTEEGFVKDVLTPHLLPLRIYPRAILIGKRKNYRGGGGNSYARIALDINGQLRQNNKRDDFYLTTMLDLYALPTDFPQFDQARKIRDPRQRVRFLEQKLAKAHPDRRFLPYLQLHEFESLPFADLTVFESEFPDAGTAIQHLANQLKYEANNDPELLNDRPATAPSKRLLKQLADYDKTLHGPMLTYLIGLSTLRMRCLHFGAWLTKLESLVPV